MITSQFKLLRRHRLAYISDRAWSNILDRTWSAPVQECLSHWRIKRLPLVITKQHAADLQDDVKVVCLAISAPAHWQRQRILVRVHWDQILYFDEFPRLEEAAIEFPQSTRPRLGKLQRELQAIGSCARVYGSYGWQYVSHQLHTQKSSDIDVWMHVYDDVHADMVVGKLAALEEISPRLDGELVFPGDVAVSWREWQRWRVGKTQDILEKTLFGARLRTSDSLRFLAEETNP